MPRMTADQLRRRDMKRDIGNELLQAAREMKAGKAAQIHQFDNQGTAILGGRRRSRLSVQVENATLEHFLDESRRTGKEFRTLINEVLTEHAFLNRRPVTASEVRKIFRQELARSTKGRVTQSVGCMVGVLSLIGQDALRAEGKASGRDYELVRPLLRLPARISVSERFTSR